MTYQEAVSAGEYILEKAKIADFKYDAFALLSYVCHMDKTQFLLNRETEMSQEEKIEYRAILAKRVEHIPLQYLVGEQWFMGLPFKVNSSVLIPRQDTETLVEEVLKRINGNMRVLDMCTGSGCIITSLKALKPEITAVASDISKSAILVAKENAKQNHVQVEFFCGNLFEKIPGDYDIIVSNPPYIPTSVIDTLDDEVKKYEPYDALDGKEDGLYFYRLIVAQSKEHLRPSGWLCLEIGHDQGQQVQELMLQEGYQQVEVIKDLAGNHRVVIGSQF